MSVSTYQFEFILVHSSRLNLQKKKPLFFYKLILYKRRNFFYKFKFNYIKTIVKKSKYQIFYIKFIILKNKKTL